jgi:hypothetical protein
MHMERETERDLSRVADGLSPTRKIGFLTGCSSPEPHHPRADSKGFTLPIR